MRRVLGRIWREEAVIGVERFRRSGLRVENGASARRSIRPALGGVEIVRGIGFSAAISIARDHDSSVWEDALGV